MRKMSDFSTGRSMKDLIFEYNFVNFGSKLVWFELIFVALIVGLGTESYGWGVGIFILLVAMLGIPLVSGVYTLAFSLFESWFIWYILFNLTTPGWCWFISICFFYILVELHRSFGDVDYVTFGYSLIVFDGLIISIGVYAIQKTIILPIIVFVLIFALAFIPLIRVIESIALTILTAVFMYSIAFPSSGTTTSLGVAAFALIYSGVSYIFVYMGIDYIGILKAKKRAKAFAESEQELSDIKHNLYNKFPDLEKNYYYFYTQVCKTDSDKEKFNFDWNKYLYYLNRTSNIITFNEYFEQEKLYRTSHYNSDFAQKHSEWNKQSKQEKFNSANNEESIYFAGVDSLESLKKRYHDLIKIYHPDNQNGDHTISQHIQDEYDSLLKKYEN